MGKVKVLVLMCSYNGRKYIREQIDSILKQDKVDVSVIVRDDGSNDGTQLILDEYKKNNKFDWYQGINVGPAVGFMELLYRFGNNEYDYFAFSDQDDIWFSDKLYNAVNRIDEVNDKYVLYGSNQILYKNDKADKKVYDELPILSLPYLLNHNMIAGCTIVINNQLAKLIVNSKHINAVTLKSRMHDLWIVLIACSCGTVVFDMSPSMYYRIHSFNVIGESDNSLKKRIYRLINDRGDRSNPRSRYASELLRCFDKSIKDDEKDTVELYACYKESFTKKLRFLQAKEVIKQTGENGLVFRIKILLNYI